jgi:hypothetical protein
MSRRCPSVSRVSGATKEVLMSRFVHAWVGPFLSLVLVLGVGCSSDSSEKGAKARAERQMGEALSQGAGGQTKVDLGSKGSVDLSGLPENFRYPGAKALAHSSNAGPGGGDMYVLETDDPPPTVAGYFKEKLADWKPVHAFESPKMTTLVYQTQDGAQQVSIVVGTERRTGKTNMSVTLSAK